MTICHFPYYIFHLSLTYGLSITFAPGYCRRRLVRRRRLRARGDRIEDCKANQKWREPDDSLH
jgi:hypothetical protein